MNIALRLTYSARGQFDWQDTLKEYLPIGRIELAFYLPEDFDKVEPEKVYQPVLAKKMKVASIHLPHIDFTKLALVQGVLRKIELISQKLDCRLLVAHPSFGRFEDFAKHTLPFLNNFLKKGRIDFCWETFLSRRRILNALDLPTASWRENLSYWICYDISHVGKFQDKVLSDLDKYLSFIKIIHASNFSPRKQHLPLWSAGGMVDFNQIIDLLKKKEYSGELVLEYLPEFHHRLVPDGLKLQKMMS